MGWHPDQVRSLSLSDFAAALNGFRSFHGIKDGPNLTAGEIADLRQMIDEDD